MKNKKQERMRIAQREHHRNHPWRMNKDGVHVMIDYSQKQSDGLSWWSDFGFLVNRRRVLVCWEHPRMNYADNLNELAYQHAGEAPDDDRLLEAFTKNYKNVGKSRKKVISYTCSPISPEGLAYYEILETVKLKLADEGADYSVRASWKRRRCNRYTWISLVVPLEIRNEEELAIAAKFAKRLLLGCEFRRKLDTRSS